jgi:surface protein
MAINTLITIRDAIQAFVDGHGQLQSVGFGADDKRAPYLTEQELFPVLYVAPVDVEVGRAHNTHRLRVYVYERLNDADQDEWENANDTSLILRDIRVWWNDYGVDDILIETDPTGTFKTDSELDNLVGYYAEILFQIPSHGRCDVPVSIEPIPPPTCEDASYVVEYANGDPIESGSIPSGGSVTVVVPNPIVCQDVVWTLFDTDGNVLDSGTEPAGGTLTIVAPDATFDINGVQVATILSGGSDSIEVRRASGSTQVGSLQGQHWRVANTTVQLRDSAANNIGSVNSYGAESSNNLTAPDGTVTVNRDGVFYATQAVRSNGTATINVPSAEWIRPTDWLPMPTVTSAQQTFVGLHAVIENGDNYVAFLFTTSTGQYQVNWGDGTTTLHNSNTIAQKQYDFATYDTGNTTLTTRGYKQAMITVTPVSGNLLTCNFQQRYVTVPAQNQAYSTGFLDCILSMPNASSGLSIVFGGTTVRHTYVERVNVLTIGGCTNMANMFLSCFSLQSVPLFNTANVTNMGSMFEICRSLQSVPLFNTANVTNMSFMFSGCTSLQSVPLFNTQNVTTMVSMFNGCNSLQSVPLFNTANVTNMSSMFSSCFSLQSVPSLNTANVTNMSSMFQLCYSLQTVPLFNTANVTNMNGMFRDAQFSLNSIPALSTAAITSDFTNFALNSNSLNRCQMVFQRTVSFNNCQLSRDAIVEIFNNLAVVVLATITITGNWGVTALSAADLLIATSKGWTVIQ